jgi:hypothetical protein
MSAASTATTALRGTVSNATTAESVLDQVSANLPTGATAEWSPNAPFTIVPATETTEGRIRGTIIIRVGNSSTAVLVDAIIPRLAPGAGAAATTGDGETAGAGDQASVAPSPQSRRIMLSLDSYEMFDLYGNMSAQIMDVRPIVVNDRTLIPVRFIGEALGANIGWNDATREVTISIDGRTLTFAIGEMAPGMDVPAQIMGERTIVPLRFISEFFGAEVNWNEPNRSIEIVKS